MSSEQGLRLHDVTVRYGSIVAVDSVDMDIEAGRIVGLLGPSGCGKELVVRVHSQHDGAPARPISIFS